MMTLGRDCACRIRIVIAIYTFICKAIRPLMGGGGNA